jgi:hypothetical protein
MSTAYLLKKLISDQEVSLFPPPIPPPVLVDYFGENWNEENGENRAIILGVYRDLIKYKGVTCEFLHGCFLRNQLDELIHKKYTHHQSGYYKKFVARQLKIGQTYFNFEEDPEEDLKPLEILDDSYCPLCNNNDDLRNCSSCFQIICQSCFVTETTLCKECYRNN